MIRPRDSAYDALERAVFFGEQSPVAIRKRGQILECVGALARNLPAGVFASTVSILPATDPAVRICFCDLATLETVISGQIALAEQGIARAAQRIAHPSAVRRTVDIDPMASPEDKATVDAAASATTWVLTLVAGAQLDVAEMGKRATAFSPLLGRLVAIVDAGAYAACGVIVTNDLRVEIARLRGVFDRRRTERIESYRTRYHAIHSDVKKAALEEQKAHHAFHVVEGGSRNVEEWEPARQTLVAARLKLGDINAALERERLAVIEREAEDVAAARQKYAPPAPRPSPPSDAPPSPEAA